MKNITALLLFIFVAAVVLGVNVLENCCEGAKAGVGAYLNGMCTY